VRRFAWFGRGLRKLKRFPAQESRARERIRSVVSLLAAALPELTWHEEALRLGLAALLGGIIGIEREFREREAGLRTHMLVAVGAALFTVVSAFGFRDVLGSGSGAFVRLDPSRIAAQIVSGIGFLGAGAIIRQGLSIRGLTTAATLWAVAAIGMAAGAGSYAAAVITTLLVLFMLWPLRYVGKLLDRDEVHRLDVDLTADGSPRLVVETVERLGARLDSFEVSEDARTVEVKLHLPRGLTREVVVRALVTRHGIRGASWSE
jgi:putative Mg2+ transporter-C (MgtC) family protein